MYRIDNQGENFNHMLGYGKNKHCKRLAWAFRREWFETGACRRPLAGVFIGN